MKWIRAVLCVIFILPVVVSGLYLPLESAEAQDLPKLDVTTLTAGEKGNPKLDSQLNQLVSRITLNDKSVFVPQKTSEAPEERVRVVIECQPGQVDTIIQAIYLTGVLETSYKNLVQALIPVSILTTLSEIPGVEIIRQPYEPIDSVASEGVSLTNDAAWQNAGYNGVGVKIAILDGGFAGYSNRIAEGELPADVITHWFRSDEEGTSAHGTACAEIIYDMAPGAQIYLVSAGTDVEAGAAVEWLIDQDVDIISFSGGWPVGGPGDGTGTLCEMVDDARNNGILWVNSAGNSASSHWQGDFVDSNANGFVDFIPGVDVIAISADKSDPIRVYLKWNDPWGSSTNDYELLLLDGSLDDDHPVAYSQTIQNGHVDPVEIIHIASAPYTGNYYVAIARVGNPAPVNFHLFSYPQNLYGYATASGSLLVPADSASSVTVGAVDCDAPSDLEEFSSQGPTTDARTKPDLVAPDGVSTVTYGIGGFFGTSASAPHVAGAAAVIKSRYPSYSPAQIQSYLESRAVALGETGKDNLYGSGLLDLSFGEPPTMEPLSESPGGYFRTSPVLSNFGFDDDIDLDAVWYRMDSEEWTTLDTDFSGTTWDRDDWTIPDFASLSQGSHRIYFKAADDSGTEEGESGEWSWQFYKDTVNPTNPTAVRSSSHILSTWSQHRTIDISWVDATDSVSGLDGYSVLWNTSPSTVPDGTKDIEEGIQKATSIELAEGQNYYFHIRSVDKAGNWRSDAVHLGPFFIDFTGPTGPANLVSANHTIGTWSDDITIEVSWTASEDSTSGLDGYSILWDNNSTTLPDNIKDVGEDVTAVTSPELKGSNSHYFHIRAADNAGNWQTEAGHLGPFYITESLPSMETIKEPPNQYYRKAPVFSNLGFDDDVALDDGWYQIDSFNGTWIELFSEDMDTAWNGDDWTLPAFDDLDEGPHTIFFMARDDAGNIQGESGEWSWQFNKDTNPPSIPGDVTSPSHKGGVWSNDNTVDITWTDAVDEVSGLSGYSYIWDTAPDTLPDTTKDIGAGIERVTSDSLSDGDSHYFHIRSADTARNWQAETVHLGPFYIDTVAPTGSSDIHSTSHAIFVSSNITTISNIKTISIAWTQAVDKLSGIDGYSVLWNNNTESLPVATKNLNVGLTSLDTTLTSDGIYYFHIRAVDKAGNWQVDARHLGPFVIAVNTPVLSGASITPSAGTTENTYQFSVIYTDLENEAPAWIKVKLDDGALQDMAPKSGQDNDYTNGEIYEYYATGNLSTGTHTFRFSANDGEDDAMGDISSHFGPEVSSAPFQPPIVAEGEGNQSGGAGASSDRIYLTQYMTGAPGIFTSEVNLKSYDGMLKLSIPSGAKGLTAESWALSYIIIDSLPADKLDLPAPDNGYIPGLIYKLEPDGVNFTPQVLLTMLYRDDQLPQGINEKDLAIGYWDISKKAWVKLEGSMLDPVSNTISALLSHFSIYAILAFVPEPVPAKFSLSDLIINPEDLLPEQEIRITTTVANIGGSSGKQDLQLIINGVLEETRSITLDPGDSENVDFILFKLEPGDYLVDINGITSSFRIKELPAPPPQSTSVSQEQGPDATPPTAIPTSQGPPTTTASNPADQGQSSVSTAWIFSAGLVAVVVIIVILLLRQKPK